MMMCNPMLHLADLFLVYLLLNSILIFTTTASNHDITPQQITYLHNYGYLDRQDPSAGTLKTQQTLKDSIKKFQHFAGLPATGLIDDKTSQKFQQPRCGVKDETKNEGGRKRRYAHQGSKWDKKYLTYRIENFSNDLSKEVTRKTIDNALKRWERASQIRFAYVESGDVDIRILFTRLSHDDRYAFDGPGGTLAHAFYPGNHPLSGDLHFDDDETFTVRSKKGKNFYWVVLHEIGHSLGLEHSNMNGAIMYPWYSGYKGYDVDLSLDDKRGIQTLYGLPLDIPDARTDQKPTENTADDNGCLRRVKAIYANRYGETIVLDHDQVHVYDKNLKQHSKDPVAVQQYFKGGMSTVDAAIFLPDSRIVFFHGDSVYEYFGQRRRRNARNSQTVYGDGIFNIDAAFYWRKAKKVYIFKGHVYWRYDPNKMSVDEGYPKLIKNGWQGVPDDIDAVYEWDSKVFFFKGDQYYRFDAKRYLVIKQYPRPIKQFLLCQPRRLLLQPGKIISSDSSGLTDTSMNSSGNQPLPITWFLFANVLLYSLLHLVT